MNLTTLRAEFLDHVDDPAGDVWAPSGSYTRTDRLINRAYEHLVSRMDASGNVFNRCPTPIDVTLVAGTQEYALAPSDGIRQIIEVVRVDTDGTELPITVVEYANRMRTVRHRTGYGLVTRQVYLYRLATGVWQLGLVDVPTETGTLRVYYAPTLAALSDSNLEVVQLPAQWHRLIALRAAWTALGQEKRDNSDLAAEYGDAYAMFQQSIERVTTTTKSRPI
jgi:hypothetical protein